MFYVLPLSSLSLPAIPRYIPKYHSSVNGRFFATLSSMGVALLRVLCRSWSALDSSIYHELRFQLPTVVDPAEENQLRCSSIPLPHPGLQMILLADIVALNPSLAPGEGAWTRSRCVLFPPDAVSWNPTVTPFGIQQGNPSIGTQLIYSIHSSVTFSDGNLLLLQDPTLCPDRACGFPQPYNLGHSKHRLPSQNGRITARSCRLEVFLPSTPLPRGLPVLKPSYCFQPVYPCLVSHCAADGL